MKLITKLILPVLMAVFAPQLSKAVDFRSETSGGSFNDQWEVDVPAYCNVHSEVFVHTGSYWIVEFNFWTYSPITNLVYGSAYVMAQVGSVPAGGPLYQISQWVSGYDLSDSRSLYGLPPGHYTVMHSAFTAPPTNAPAQEFVRATTSITW